MNSFPSYKGNRFDRWEMDPPSEPMVVTRSPNGIVQPIDGNEEGNPNPSDIPRLHKLNATTEQRMQHVVRRGRMSGELHDLQQIISDARE